MNRCKSASRERLRLFEAADFATYRAWYADAELDEHLGPMDEDWLAFVLADQEGRQFSYLQDEMLAAVVGVRPIPNGTPGSSPTSPSIRPGDARGWRSGRWMPSQRMRPSPSALAVWPM